MSLKEAIPESLLEKDPELAKLADLLDYGLDGLKNYINSSSYKFDVMTMPMEEATRWLKAFGWKENWDVDKAKLLKAVILLYRLGGTDQGMKMAIENFTGIDVILIDEAWPKAYKAGLTLTDDEKRNVTVYLSYAV
jgi:hypothetical protein